MTKSELFNNVRNEVLSTLTKNKVSKKIRDEIDEIIKNLLEPKRGGKSIHAPKEIDGVMHYWCRFHQRYEAVDNMVMSKDGKSKGYCKAASAKSEKFKREAKKLQEEALKALTMGEMEEAQKLANNAKQIRECTTNYDCYDYEKDWEEYTPRKVNETK